MLAYIARRLVQMVPVLFLITLFVFFLVRLVPGDPALIMLGNRATEENIARLRAHLGLDQPLLVQYGRFLGNLAHGDLGESVRRGEPVTGIIRDRMPPTLFLVGYALLLAVVISLPLATIGALRQERWPDQLVRVFVLVALAMPTYWIGMMLLQTFAVKLKAFPVAGYGDTLPEHLHSLFLPALALALGVSSVLTRSLRNALLETMAADHVRTARAKGLNQPTVVIKHALRNAMTPVITLGALEFGTLLSGAVLTEQIFTIPGFGKLIVDAVFNRDYAVVQGVVLCTAIGYIGLNLLADVLYVVLNPRLRTA